MLLDFNFITIDQSGTFFLDLTKQTLDCGRQRLQKKSERFKSIVKLFNCHINKFCNDVIVI